MLRLAETNDLNLVFETALKFIKASNYNKVKLDEPKMKAYAELFVSQTDPTRLILLAFTDDTDNPEFVGMLACEQGESYFNNDRVAIERILWVEEKHRKSHHALKMIEAFEWWGKNTGCKLAQLSALHGVFHKPLDKFYNKLGYKQAEYSFLKAI